MQDFMFVQRGNAINRTAHNVVFGPMEHFEIKAITGISGAMHSDNLIPFKKYWAHPKYDFTGKKHGAFTVLGVYKKSSKAKQLSWVLRCSCGAYEIRSGKIIYKYVKSDKECQDMCNVCLSKKRLKQGVYKPRGNEYD